MGGNERVIAVRAFAILCFSLAAVSSVAAPLDGLTFKDTRYLPRKLENLGPAEYRVILFVASREQASREAMRDLAALAQEPGTDAAVLALSADARDSIMDVALATVQAEAFLPAGKDFDARWAKALGVTHTPTAVVLDAKQEIRYRGAPGQALRAALAALAKGEATAPPEAWTQGAAIAFDHAPEPDAKLTYADVKPILGAHCTPCHQNGGGAPMPFTRYKKVRDYADMIGEVVREERMPPWYAHPDFGAFKNDRRIKPEDRQRLLKWLAAGAPQGAAAEDDAEDKSPPAGEWRIAPDLVVSQRQASALPATGFIPYQYVYLPYTAEEDTYIQGIQIKGTNPAVVHHANLFYTSDKFQADPNKNFLTGMVPGGVPSVLEPGRAWFVPKGGTLALQVHLVTTGKPEMNRIEVALQFAKGTVQKKLYYKNLDDPGIRIPPFAPGHPITRTMTLEGDATGLGLFGHMHLRGRDMTFTAAYPGGKKETLMVLPNYDFNWQITYSYPENTFRFPKDTEITCLSHYDNSRFNPYNPDPAAEVREGPQTVDEMMNGFFVYTLDAEQLNLNIDSATGHVRPQLASN